MNEEYRAMRIITDDGNEFGCRWNVNDDVQPKDMVGKPLTFGAYKATIVSVAYIEEEHE